MIALMANYDWVLLRHQETETLEKTRSDTQSFIKGPNCPHLYSDPTRAALHITKDGKFAS